jgi:hypothetical protein
VSGSQPSGFELEQQKLSEVDYKSDRLIKLEDDKISLDKDSKHSIVFVILIFELGTITLSNKY